MSNPFALPVDWQALATFLTGVAAVLGAMWVGNRQLQLRRNELRLSLFQQRREVLLQFRALKDEWQVGAALPEAKLSEFQRVVRDVELLFADDTHRAIEEIFKDTAFQNMFARHAEMFSRSGNEVKRLKAVANEQDKLEQVADKLPELEAQLVKATRVGHLFP